MISVKQLSMLTVVLIFATAILYLPSISLKHSGNGGFLSPWVSMIVGMIVILMMVTLFRAYHQPTFLTLLKNLLGQPLGIIVSFLYIFYFFNTGLYVLRESIGIIRATLLPTTPILMICFTISFAYAFGIYNGIQAVARFTQLIIGFVPIIVIILFLGVLGKFHVSAFLPLLDEGFMGVIRGAYIPASWFGEVILLWLLFPYLRDNKQLITHLLISILVVAFLVSIITIAIIGLLGVTEASRTELASYEVMRYVEFGDFFQHIDALFLFPWILFMVIKGLLFFFVTVDLFGEVFAIKNKAWTILPLVILSSVTSHWLFLDDFSISQYLEIVWPMFALFFELILPILFFILFLLRRSQRRPSIRSS